MGRGRPRDLRRLRPRRRADPELRAAAAAAAGRDQPRRRGRDEELPRRRRASRPTPRPARSSQAVASAPLDGLAERLHGVRARGAAARSTRARCASSTRSASPSPTTAIVVADMCIPGYWLAGFHTPAAPRRLQIPLGWGTLGYAFPAALGAALAGGGPVVAVAGDGGFLYAAGRARHGRPGADPADARDRRRRRLRDAALRPGRDGQPTATASTCSRRTSPRSCARSGSARRRSTGSTTSSARRSPSTCSTRSRACCRPHARAARPAPEHLAELVPAQEDDARAGARVPARAPPPGRAGAATPPTAAFRGAAGHAAGLRRRRRWPRAPTSARRRSTSWSTVPSLRGAATAVAPADLAIFTTGLEPGDEEEAKHLTGNAWKDARRASARSRRSTVASEAVARRAGGRPAGQGRLPPAR